MTLRDMEIFAAVAKSGRMSEAARELYISTSSVSQVIARVEREYGLRLFESLSRRLYLTAEGREALDGVNATLRARRELERTLAAAGERRTLRVGATVTVGICVMSGLLTRLRERDAGILPEVLVANTHILEEKLLLGELDLALVEGRVKSGSLAVRPAMRDTLSLCCGRGHRFWGRASVAAEELEGEALILREPGSGTRAQLEDALARRGVRYRAAWVCYSPQAIINAVADCHGVTVISKRLVEGDGRIWACPIEGMELSRSFDLVYHREKTPSAQMRAFTDICGGM